MLNKRRALLADGVTSQVPERCIAQFVGQLGGDGSCDILLARVDFICRVSVARHRVSLVLHEAVICRRGYALRAQTAGHVTSPNPDRKSSIQPLAAFPRPNALTFPSRRTPGQPTFSD